MLIAASEAPEKAWPRLMNRETREQKLRHGLSATAVGNNCDLKVLSQGNDILGEILAALAAPAQTQIFNDPYRRFA